jgi:hypothetical protein
MPELFADGEGAGRFLSAPVRDFSNLNSFLVERTASEGDIYLGTLFHGVARPFAEQA